MQQPRTALNLGEYRVTRKAEEIVCYGLGSCVGLFLFDRVNKVAAAAHVVLSGELEKETTLNANTAFHRLIEGIKHLGGDINTLRAKIVGGANIFGSEFEVGSRNVSTLAKLIRDHKIYLAGMDVGGNVGRTAIFNTSNGTLNINSLQEVKSI